MNILFLSTRLTYPPVGGHSQRTFNIVKHLSQKHDIYYVSFFRKGLNEIQKREYLAGIGKYCKECYTFDIPLEKSIFLFALNLIKSICSFKPFIAYKYHCNAMGNCIKDILFRININFVHFDMLPLAEYKNLVPNINCLLTEHNVEYLRYARWFPYEKNILKKIYIKQQYKKLRNYEIEVVRKFKQCIVVSDFDRNALFKDVPNVDFRIIPNGTDINYFKPHNLICTPPKPNTLVWVGGMTMWPNRDAIDYFMKEIFPLILEKNPKVIFKVVGRDPHPILESYKAKGQVEVYGFLEDARPVIEDSMLYVAPIRIGSGTKLKILDAMAMKKTVITTSIGAEGIEVKNQRDLFICDTPQEFAMKTVMLLNNWELNEKIGKNARKFVEEKYAWDKIFVELDKLYE